MDAPGAHELLIWVTWGDRGAAHAARLPTMDVYFHRYLEGGFPLLCGRMAPCGWDANISRGLTRGPCRQCEKALR